MVFRKAVGWNSLANGVYLPYETSNFVNTSATSVAPPVVTPVWVTNIPDGEAGYVHVAPITAEDSAGNIYIVGGTGLDENWQTKLYQVRSADGPVAAPINLGTIKFDAHATPGLLALASNKLGLIQAGRGLELPGPYLGTAKTTGANWGVWESSSANLNDNGIPGLRNLTYTMAHRFADGLIRSYHRNTDYKGTFVSWAADLSSITNQGLFFNPPTGQRIYTITKADPANANILHFLMSDGNPGDASNNGLVEADKCGLRHMYYERSTDSYYRTNGTLIRTHTALAAGAPIVPRTDCTEIDDGWTYGAAWGFDLAVDGSGNPHVMWVSYSPTVFAAEKYYWAARWNGSTWVKAPIYGCGPTTNSTFAVGTTGGRFHARDPNKLILGVLDLNGVDLVQFDTANSGVSWLRSKRLTAGGRRTGTQMAGTVPEAYLPTVHRSPNGSANDALIWTARNAAQPDTSNIIYASPGDMAALSAATPITQSRGILTGGTVAAGLETTVVGYGLDLYLDPTDLPTMSATTDGTGANPAANGELVLSMMSKGDRQAVAFKPGVSLESVWADRTTYKAVTINSGAEGRRFVAPFVPGSRFAFVMAVRFIGTAGTQDLLSTDNEGFHFTLDSTRKNRAHRFLRYTGGVFSFSLRRVLNDGNTQGTTFATFSAATGTTIPRILTVYSDGTTVFLRYDGAPGSSVALNGNEVWQSSFLTIGSMRNPSDTGFTNFANAEFAALIAVGDRLGGWTTAQIGNMEILAGQKAGRTITPTW